MRLFLAIPLSDEIRTELTAIQKSLQSANAEVRWVAPENFHLTVAFLGDLDNSLLEPIEEVCAGVAAGAFPFRLRVRGGSAFPKRGPLLKTLWVGVSEGVSEWRTLAEQAETNLRVFGTAPKNELVPHITLGRVKGEQGRDALRASVAAQAQTDCGTQIADRLMLVQSLLNPDGAVYKEVRSWPFGGINNTK